MQAVARVDGARIKQARLGAGLTQAQLARAIASTERNIARWENGANQPRMGAVVAIATATKRELDFFLEGSKTAEDDDEEADPMSLDAALRRHIRRIVQEETGAA